MAASEPTDQPLGCRVSLARDKADPQQAIRRAQLRPGHRSLVHGKLLAEGEVVEGELTMAAEEEGEDPKQVEQEGNHRAESVAGSRPADQPLTRRRGFGEGQVP
jgi:hypothetical protein